MSQTDDHTRLTDYLLGRLSPEEATSIEERYLADPAFHDELRAAERDLIDRYVQGELSDAEEFETRFLSSPSRRQRVEFARALNHRLTRAPGVGATASGAAARPASWRRGFAGPQRTGLAAAAVLVLAAAAWFLVTGRSDQPRAIPASPTPQTQPGPVAEAPRPDVAPPSRGEPGVDVRVATLILTPTATRSSDETPTLRIAGAAGVRLVLYAESSGFDRYRATIRTGDGKEVWRQDQLTRTATASGPAIIVALPAGRLDANDYTIRLSGIRGAEVEEIAGYSFRVRK